MDGKIEAHNERPATVWGSGGDAYNEISHQIASALDHCVLRINPQPNERILDLATGTGWTSRLLARRGAKVTGADIATDLLAAAKARAKAENFEITYQIGDAEKLPFADGSFDAVVSTFGVMFASHPEAAAAEMARVCRKGGRLGLATWTPDGNVYKMFVVMRPYMPTPANPAPPSPFAWGNRDRVQERLGSSFDLKFEEGITTYYDQDGKAAWHAFSTGYGPTKALANSLDDARRAQLQSDFAAFHDEFATDIGIAVPREYLLTIGTRH
ncbi:class I SAM-dependent methyltransferase [Paralcaligenes sp. KSB-10]|uniref:class I SAM-dependent methyltransferase n=1 Tax=Paralcaligenes sp. KSB-10 TaxID=2901142 RepID=UPI001E5929B2|nr:class I SAM-dependent methyltransferase [Paralcaligenes sp. KSB-10]UHL63215.1 class I SAM-dependent methyltransferase [Paralcaligenes sp. KSB-10]